ncbi:hypothetical protein [Microtetraspora sp. NBRC 16547]|uniref:hypothetical protein n=1 Tax=Microtetraspora sp. NBRC 16547 TaxID=3030993 RepID=UPI00249FD43F|nr:hypothetical protein [Microtetraspora sp. NBRC 16547]GLX01889.1 hypothetical protein Misp02_59750 [Microtetraspora sp. NBRC 16547]
MSEITQIITRIRSELAGELRERVRDHLRAQPTEWLVEQILTLARLDDTEDTTGDTSAAATGESAAGTAMPAIPRQTRHERPARETEEDRAARAARIRMLRLDGDSLPRYLQRYGALKRDVLEAAGYLRNPPPKGGDLVPAGCRSPQGEALLCQAKDLLHALLFGGEEEGVRLNRVERELLTLAVPSAKSHAVAPLLRAATGIGVEGTWRDPLRVAADDQAADTVYQLEYGGVAGEALGNAIVAALRLINNLELNEQVLYTRTESAEESTLEI